MSDDGGPGASPIDADGPSASEDPAPGGGEGDARRRATRRGLLRAGAAAGLLGAAAVGTKAWLAEPARPHPWFRPDDPDVLVLAHAGGKHLRPDNTLLAFDHAVGLGADVIETDLQLTADGVPVLNHDSTVDARTDGSGRVDEHTLDELKALDAAYHWSPPGGNGHPYRGEGLEIPTLDEALAAHPDCRWNVELKGTVDDVEPFCRVVRDRGMTEQVLAASFTPILADVRDACPGVATSAHRNEVVRFLVASRLGLEATYDAPARAFQVPRRTSGVRVLTEGFVEAAHDRAMDVHAWTINERAALRRLADLGADGLITDRPDLALSVLGRGA